MKQDNYPNTQTTRFNRWMLMAGIAMLSLFATGVNAQIAVTVDNPSNTTPNLQASYTDLATALADVNAVTAMSGPVTLTLSGSETAPVKGFVIGSSTLNPVLSATNTITLMGPATINAGVGTAPDPNELDPDGMFVINGADYITLDSLTFTDGNNTNTTESMEFGVGLFKLSDADGAQYNTIQNCVFNMQRLNNISGSAATMQEGSIAIRTVNSIYTAANAALTITTAAGTNSYNKFYGNTINGGNAGISLNGPTSTTPFTTGDTGNDVGGTSASTGNFIYNYGGGGTSNAAVGIRANNQWGVNISYNTINNNDGGGVNHATTLRGIYAQAGTSASANINNNTVTLHGGGTSSQLSAIENAIGSTAASNTININNNIVQNSTYATATTATFYSIYNTSSAATVNINNNTVSGNAMGTAATNSSCTFYGIYSSGSATNLTTNSNTITGNYINNNGGSLYCLRPGTSLWTADGNIIHTNGFASTGGALSASLYGMYSFSSPTQETITNNEIYNLTIAGTSTSSSSNLTGILTNSVSGSVKDISDNLVHSLSYSASGSAAIHGISNTTGNTISIYRNKIYDLSATGASSTVFGISLLSTGTTYTVHNNLIGNLNSSTASLSTDAVRGINITATSSNSTINVAYNSVYLNASSSGTNFSTSALFATTSTTATTGALTLRNNNLVNLSTPNGTGVTVAYRRSSGAANTLNNYSNSSNYNNFYAGTPGTSRLIYFDGTSSAQTINDYKTGVFTAGTVSPRDGASVTENAPFLSTTGSSSDFLHINTVSPTQLESGGTPVAGVTTDYDGDTRDVSTPDIGADEFAGIGADFVAPSIAYSAFLNGNCTGNRTLSATITDGSGINTTSGTNPRIYFKKTSNSNSLGATNDNTTDGWKYTETASGSSPFDLVVNTSLIYGGVATDDTIQYFVVAQDLAGTPNVGINSGSFAATPASVALSGAAFPIGGSINQYIVNNISLSVTASAAPATQCFVGISDLTATPTGGTSPYTYAWSPGGGTSATVSTGSLTSTTTFTVIVNDACGGADTAEVTIVVNNPQVLSTTGASTCGDASVTLQADSSSGATLKWYTASSGGTLLGTGTSFETPVITSTSVFYVAAAIDGAPQYSSRTAPSVSSGTTPSSYGLVFTANEGFRINSVDVFPVTAGNLTIQLQNSSGTPIFTSSPIALPADGGTVAHTIDLGWTVAAGAGYRLLALSGGPSMVRESSLGGFPYTIGTVGSITNGYISGTSTSYYYFYNWEVQTSCESARTAVIATHSSAPSISASAVPDTVCSGASVTLTATSSNDPNYKYTWVNIGSGASVNDNPTATTIYVVNALDTTAGTYAGCVASAQDTVVVKPLPSTVTITPSSANICAGDSILLVASGGALSSTAVSGSGTLQNTGTGYPSPYGAYYESVKQQYLIRASELTAMGFNAGSEIASIAFDVASVGTSGQHTDYTISLGHTATSTLTTTFETGTSVHFGPVNYQPVSGWNTHTLTTTFVWNGTSNLVVEICHSNDPLGAGNFYSNNAIVNATNPGFVSVAYRNVDNVDTCDATTASSTSSNRPNMRLEALDSPDSWSWSPNTSDNDSVYVTPTSLTIYTATATNGGCTNSGTATVDVNTPTASISGGETICEGESGDLTFTFTGVGPYEVVYTDGASNFTVSGIASSPHVIQVSPVTTSTYTIVSAATSLCSVDGSNISGSATITVNPTPTVNITGSDNFCPGDSVLLTANTTGTIATYAWSDGSPVGLDQNTHYATSYASYTVTVTSDLGCTATSTPFAVSITQYTITATAGPDGTIDPIGAVLVDCGSNQTFDMLPDVGRFVDDVVVDAVSQGVLADYTFTNVQANHTIHVTFNAGACANPATANAGSDNTICPEGTHTLAGSIGGTATSGTWSSSGTGTFSPSTDFATATTYTPSSADSAAGFVTLTLTTDDPDGGGPCVPAVSNMTLSFHVSPTASITGTLGICPGDSTLLDAGATAGSGTITSYQWELDGSTSLGTASTQYASLVGSYTVTVTNSNGCSYTSDAVNVTAYGVPTASISGASTVCAGVPEILTASATAGEGTIVSYQWVLNGVTNVGTGQDTLSASVAGSYTVIVTNSAGCSITSAAHILGGAGPLVGTYTIDATQPASCTNFQSFANAFAELNLNGVGGHVLFNVAAGQSDTANLTLDMCSLGANAPNATQTLTFRKSGVGANPLITAGTGSGSTDAIVKIVGVDYLTFDAIDLQENANNTTADSMAEAGYVLLKCSGTDGAQNDTIQNCVVTLYKANPNTTVGIYAPNLDAAFSAVTVTATSGSHSNNKFFNNTVSNSYIGISIGGFNDVFPYDYYDHNNEIGAVGAGNMVSNIGGGAGFAMGIVADYQDDFSVSGNTVNTGTGSTGNMNALRLGDMKNSNVTVDGNTLTLQADASNTAQCIVLRSSAGSRLGRPESDGVNNVVNITNNTIENCTYAGSNDLWLMFLGRAAGDTLAAYNLNVTGNQIINNTSSATNATGNMYGIIAQATGDSVAITNNNISNNTMNGATGHAMRMIVTGFNSITNSLPYSPKFNVSGNSLLNNVSSATTGTVTGISVETYTGASPQAGTELYVNNNQVGAATLSAQTTGAYTAISAPAWAGADVEVSGNKVYDIVRSAATTGAFLGINVSSGAANSLIIENDTVSGVNMSAATSATFNAITSAGAPITQSSISNNLVTGNTASGTGVFNGVANTGGALYLNMEYNTVTSNTKAGTGTTTFISNTSSTPDVITISNNTVSNNIKTGTGTISLMSHGAPDTLTMNNNTISNNEVVGGSAATTLNCVLGSTCKYVFDGNLIENNYVTSMTGSSVATVTGYSNSGSPTEETITNNIIRRLSVSGTSTGLHNIRGFLNNTTTTTGSFRIMSDNVIDSLYSNAGSSAIINGIVTSIGLDVSIFRNKIYDLYPGQSGTSLSRAVGISSTSGTNVNIYNNLIGLDLSASAPVLVSNDAVRGIEVTGGTGTVALRHNTIRLAGSGSGTGFGSSGISLTSTGPTVIIANNIVLNLTAPGGGTAAASAIGLRRISTAMTGYSDLSDNNIWYAGSPSASNLLYYDGTAGQQDLTGFQGAVTAPREINSRSENTNLLSTTGANADFLHVNSAIPTFAESGANAVGGISEDFDGDIRFGNIGYAGTGTAPDIGADEFNGATPAPQITNVILTPADTCVAVSHQISADVSAAVGAIDSVMLSYSFDNVPQTPIVLYAPTTLPNTYTFTIPAATPTNAVVTWSLNGASNLPLFTNYVGTPYQDDYLSTMGLVATANPAGPICELDSITLTASAPLEVDFGTNTTTSSTSGLGPYTQLYEGAKAQFLITAAELAGAGLTAGDISSLAFDITSAGTTIVPLANYTVKMAHTSMADLGSAYETSGLTTVWGPTDHTVTVGWNTHTFTTPFTWNGTDNVIVDICFDNDPDGTCTGGSGVCYGSSTTFRYTATTGTTTVRGNYGDNSSVRDMCNTPDGSLTTSANRPNMRLIGSAVSAVSLDWTDGTNTVGSGTSITIAPTTTAAYTVVLTDPAGCTTAAITDTVEVFPAIAAPVGVDSIQCGVGSPYIYVQGTPGATFNWYDAPYGGNLLQSSTDTTYNGSISSTTTFYVAEVSMDNCPGFRVAVTATVTSPDPIDALVNMASVCPGTQVELDVVQTGSNNSYTYEWHAAPVGGSGMAGTVPGNPVNTTPTLPGTYYYYVTGTDPGANCVIIDSVEVVVFNIPAITSIDAVPDTICAGDSIVLTALTPAVVPGQAQIGTGTSTTSTYPYYRLYGSSKTQMLYLASELTAAGLQPGDITALGFDVSSVPASPVMPNVRISLMNTSVSALTASTFETGLTQVASIDTVTPVLGVNLHPITAFTWDGTSNLLVEYCFENNDGGASSTTVRYSNPGFSAVVKRYADNQATYCSNPGTGTYSNSSTIRPNLYLSGQVNGFGGGNYGWTWDPGAVSGNEITAYPTTTTNYTVTAYDSTTTCTNSATVNVFVNPTPPAPTAFNGDHCGEQTPVCYVTRSQPGTTFNWYFEATGGTPIAGQNDSILVSFPRNQVDTFYVSEVYADGPCEGPRSMLIETQNAAEAITATATVANDTICPFGTVTLSATQGSMTTYTSYEWISIPGGSTASGQNTTGTAPNTPGQVIWQVTASDGNCVTTAFDTITVYQNPVISSITASEDTVCPGTSVSLEATTPIISSGTVTLGAGATTSATYSAGFYSLWSNLHIQYLITAAELSAAGLYAGDISSLAWDVTSAGTLPMIDVSLKMGHTAATDLSSSYASSSFTTVYTNASLMPVLGINTLTFSSPFTWDGVSNIVIELCHGNGSSSATMSRTVRVDNTAYVAARKNHVSAATNAATACAEVSSNTLTYSVRPKFIFGGQTVVNGPGTVIWTWEPGSLSGDSVVVTPSATTTYTVTATDPNPPGCYNVGTITVHTYDVPSAPVNPVSLVQCGSQIPQISVTRSGPSSNTLRWYDVASGGTPLAGENDSVLTSTVVNTTTTYYVAEFNGNCEGPRTAVTVTVNQPDAVHIDASVPFLCLPGSIDLEAVQTGSTSNYVYTWTADPSGTAGLSASSGAMITSTPTASANYTFTVTATDAGASCVTIASIVVPVNEYPDITNVTAAPSTPVCAGESVVLTGYTLNEDTVRIGTGTTGFTGAANPYYRNDEGFKAEFLIQASDLLAVGLTAGPITELSTIVTTNPVLTPNNLDNYTIRMAHTAATALTTTWQTASYTTVWGPTTYSPVSGLNVHSFSTPFVWDGSSNVLVTVCYDNDPTNNSCTSGSPTCYGNNPAVLYTSSVGYAASHYYTADNTSGTLNRNMCDTSGTLGSTQTNLPRFGFRGLTSTAATGDWSWNPGSISGNGITVNPTVTTTYTGTADAGGCTTDTTITVYVNPKPAAPVANNSSQCGYGTPGAYVSGPAGTYFWYNPSGAGAPLSNSVTVNLSNPATDEGTGFYGDPSNCPGNNQIASFTLPPIPGAVLGARLTISGVTNNAGSYGEEVQLRFSGSGITGSSPCFEGATSTNTPNPFDWITGFGAAGLGDTATLAALLNTAGGTVNIHYGDGFNDDEFGPDATFPATATLQYFYQGPPGTPELIAGQNDTILIDYPISQTDSFLVVYFNDTCESEPVMVYAYVTPVDTVTATISADTICVGESVTLGVNQTGSNGNTFTHTWSSTSTASGLEGNEAGSSIVVTPTSAGTFVYTVNSVDDTCYATPSTVTLVAKAIPTVDAGPDVSVCLGTQAVLVSSASSKISEIVGAPDMLGQASTTVGTYFMEFTVTTPLTIESVDAYFAASGTPYTVLIRDAATQATVHTYSGTSTNVQPTATTIPVNAFLPAGDYQMGWQGTYPNAHRIATGANAYYTSYLNGAISITNNTFNTLSYWYYFFGWNVSVGAGVVEWTSIPPGFTHTGDTAVTGPVTGNATYVATVVDGGCVNSDTINVLLASSPGVADITASVDTVCISGSSLLTATGLAQGASVQWQISTSGLVNTWSNIGSANALTYNTGTITETRYYRLYATCGGTDTSNIKEVTVVVPTITGTTGATRCGSGLATISATGDGDKRWFTSSTGGTALFTGNPFTTIVTTTTTYWVEAVIGDNCVNASGRQPVTVTVDPAPSASFTASSLNLCLGDTLTLTASSSNSGYDYYWSTDGTTIAYSDVNPLVLVPDTTTTYYLLAIDSSGGTYNHCGAAFGPETVTVRDTPSTPVITPSSALVCAAGDTVTLSVSNIDSTAASYSVGAPNEGGGGSYTLEAGLIFDATVPFTIKGVHIYPVGTGAGTVDIIMRDPSNTIIANYTFNGTGTAAPGIKTYVPVNFSVPTPGTGYSISMLQRTGSITALSRDGSANIVGSFPFTIPGVMSIVSGKCCPSAASTSYYYFYDWDVETGTVTDYTWYPGALSGSSISVVPTATTTYSVVSENSEGCTKVSDPVTIIYSPIFLNITPSDTTVFCGSATLDLDAGAGYASYEWSDGVGVIGTTQSISVSPSVTTTYTVTVDSGACTASEMITITILPVTPITITPSSMAPICGGAGSIDLTADAGYTNYLWSPGGETTQMITVSPVATTTYTVTAEDGNGCTQEGTYTVTSNPAPAVPTITPSVAVNPLCWDGSDLGTFVTLTADTTGAGAGATIEWNDLFASTDDFIDVYAADYGMGPVTFILTVTNSFGCQSTGSILVDIDTCATAIDLDLTLFLEGYYLGGGTMYSTLWDLEQNAILTGPYPSTATDSIKVDLWDPANLSNPAPDYTETVILHNDGSATVSFATAPAGSYWLAIRHRNTLETWSSNTLSLVSGSNSYDFSTSLTQAYDDGINPPMKDMGSGVFALYSGDVNQDFTIDLNDMVEIDNNYALLAFGYDATDCSGDQATDLLDMIIVDNNQVLLLFYARPY